MKSIFNSGFVKIILITLVLGVLCTIFGWIEYSDSKKTPLDINTMSDSQIEKGAIVEGDIYYNFGVFETVENKRNGRTESTYYRYVIPVGEESYMGVQVTDSSMLAEMDKQTDETYDMMDGKIEDTTTTVHIKGKIVKMDNEDYGYFKDFMSSGGFTDDEIDKWGKEYYIQIRDFGQAKTLFIIGIVCLLISAALIVATVLKGRRLAPQPPQNFGGQSFAQQQGMGQQPGMAPQGPCMNQAQGTAPQGPGMGQPQQPQGPGMGQPQQPQDFSQYFAPQQGAGQAPQQPGFAQPQDFEQQPPQGPTNF